MRDIDYFAELWTSRKPTQAIGHTAELWDERAEEWVAKLGVDGTGNPTMTERVGQSTAYLLQRGLLTPATTVIDVGCGPGLHVLAIAPYVRRVVGLDFSKRFLEYGAGLAKRRGLANAEFIYGDFETMDLDTQGLAGAFDLAVSSLSPGVSSPVKIAKFARLSRAWCFNTSFAYVQDSENSDKPGRDGTGFYSLFNLLWLQGYYPETSYIDEIRPDSECRYGSVLWDLRKRDPR
ncbi:MAG: methyltransferase domain-containing protein [Oscillospiraceae bacterium]|jgi:SAM-dependent methyltransferase|nr:methyltransferase domain-containing protein [Oscillospiraceae bacterium]